MKHTFLGEFNVTEVELAGMGATKIKIDGRRVECEYADYDALSVFLSSKNVRQKSIQEKLDGMEARLKSLEGV